MQFLRMGLAFGVTLALSAALPVPASAQTQDPQDDTLNAAVDAHSIYIHEDSLAELEKPLHLKPPIVHARAHPKKEQAVLVEPRPGASLDLDPGISFDHETLRAAGADKTIPLSLSIGKFDDDWKPDTNALSGFGGSTATAGGPNDGPLSSAAIQNLGQGRGVTVVVPLFKILSQVPQGAPPPE
jgi:hypothetical protein